MTTSEPGTNRPFELPACVQFTRHLLLKCINPRFAQGSFQVRAEVVETEIVPSNERATLTTHKKAAPGLLTRFGQRTFQKEIEKKQNLVISIFNADETTATGGSAGAIGTGYADPLIPHGGCRLLQTFPIDCQQRFNHMVGPQTVSMLLKKELCTTYAIHDLIISQHDFGQVSVLPVNRAATCNQKARRGIGLLLELDPNHDPRIGKVSPACLLYSFETR
jgi:hypothetical protein